MTNSFEAKQEARRARLEAAADRADARADAAYKRAGSCHVNRVAIASLLFAT